MKKWIALVLILSLSLSGCAMREESAVETTEGPDEAAFLYGTWRCIQDGEEITFQNDGNAVFSFPQTGESGEFSVESGCVYLPQWIMSVGTFRGVDSLRILSCSADTAEEYCAVRHIYVREADYDRVAPQQVTITMENWETYFEMGELRHQYQNVHGEDMAIYVLGVYLKEAYVDRLENPMESLDVHFTVKRDVYHCCVQDPLGEGPVFSDISLTKAGHETQSRLGDYRQSPGMMHEAGKSGICAIINSGFPCWDNYTYFETDGEVIDAWGTMLLSPAIEE